MVIVHSAFAAVPAMECMKHNVPETLRMRQLQLQTESASGSSHLTGTVYARTGNDGGIALNMQIDAPQDLRGAAFLFRQRERNEEMYLFMPALNRVKRISGAAAETSFFGSALNNFGVEPFLAALSELRGKAVQELGITDYVGIANIAPNVAMQEIPTSFGGTVGIRGFRNGDIA